MQGEEARRTVLVVDDVPANIHVVNEILRASYKVQVATNGTKALEVAAASPAPDLILLDVVMPGMDGYEVCARLKADPATRDIPVLFLTAQTETTDETRGFSVGAVDYIHKPFSPAVVEARVQTHLALRDTREKLARQLKAIRRELDTAHRIQMSIVPREIPTVAGLDVGARYVPMTAVAGDFYDFLRVDDKRLGVLVADVSGHGMPAALISSMLKIALAAQLPHAADPARLLQELNAILCGKFEDHYVTAAYALVDTEKRTLCYAGAGHPPLLLRESSTGKVRAVEENGLFLGFFPHAGYKAVEVPFQPGDAFALYTDGVTDMTTPADEAYGQARLAAFLEDHATQPAADVAGALVACLDRWRGREAGREADDDVTFVTVRFAEDVASATR